MSVLSNFVLVIEIKLGGEISIMKEGVNVFLMLVVNLLMVKCFDFSVGNSFFCNFWVFVFVLMDVCDGLGFFFNINGC